MDSYKKGGQSGNSNLLATNRLFKKNPLFKKKKKKASGIYNPKAAFKYEEGGALLTKKVTCKNCGWKWDAADGGDDVTTCHKCGGLGLVHAQDGGDISIPTLEYQKGGFSGDDPWKKIMKTTQKKIIESAKVKKDNSDWRRANDEAPNLNYQNTNQKAPVKKLSPEDKKSQENFDKNFKVEGKGNLEKIRDKIKADQEAYKKHIKAKYNQEVSQEELNEIEERGLVMYGASNGVRNPYGSISNEDLNPENHISTQFPKNATVGDYAQRGWEYLTNPGTALEYALGTGKGPMPYNINQLKEQGVQVNSDRNLVGNMFNIINPLDDVESIRSGANQVMEGNNAGYATAGFGLLGFIPGFGDAGKALRKADNILPNPTKGTDYIWETVNKNVKGDLPEGLAKQDIADIIETKVSWIESPEYASRRMATTGETAKQVAKDVEKLKNRYQNTKITFGEIPEKKTLGYYQAQSSIKGDKILIDPTKHKSLESIIGTIDHEIDHALSPASKNHNLYKNYPFLSTKEGDILRKSQKENPQSFLSKLIKGDKSYNNVYLEDPAEQQVRFNRLNQKIREDLGLTRNKGELTETQFDEWADKQNEDSFVSVSKGHDDVVDLLGAKSDNVKRSDIVKALNKAWITVPAIGLGLGAGGLKQNKKGGSTKDYIEVDIPEEQIQDYIDQGYIIEPVGKPKMEEGGTPSQLWYQYTGTPWSEAKAKGLTDGSAEQNLALAQRLQSGEFGEPNLNIQQYENRRSSYDDAVINMVRQGQTLDQLVESRVGTREGLLQRFPDLFSGSSAPTRTQVVPTAKAKTKTPEQIAIEQKVGRDWLTGKAKELGNEVMESASNSFWGKTAKKVGQATYNYMIEQQTKDREAKKKQEQVKLKKVEKEVQKEIKKINPKVVKTPSVLELLQEVGLNYQQSPLKKFTDTKAEPDFATNLMAQVQQNQKRFNPVQTSKPQQPIANGMGSNFAQGQNPMQIEARNKAMGVTPQNLPEAPSPSIGWKKWEDTDLGYASGEIAKMVPTSAEEFIETTPGKWLGKKVYDSGLLPKEKEDQLKRKLEKLGEIPIKEESVKIDPNKKIKEINVKKNAPVTEFTEEIGSSGDGKYLSYRNQWDNKKGFEYITTRDNSDRPDDESYDNVIGVGHYLLDAYVYGDKSYSHKNNQSFLRKAKENNDWIPAFKKTNSNRVLLTYKKPSELTDKDVVVSPLRQYKFSSINFNNPISSSSLGYKANAGIKHLTTKEGDDFKVTFSNPDVYGRHSGASVVFIFKDKFDNTIVRDFAGSLNQIKEEGKSIIKDYELKSTDLTIGYHDVASYGAKPKADSSGKLKGNTWKNWNNEPHTGGALLIPKSK